MFLEVTGLLQYERIKDALPVQRGNVRLSNLQVLNAVLYVAEQGCKWRGLPKRFTGTRALIDSIGAPREADR
jgi:transposase